MLSSNLYFANSNNVSTSVSSVTPQTSLKGSETPSVKSIPDLLLVSKVLKKTFYKIYGITLRKYLTANSPSSNLNVKNWYKHRQLATTNK